MEVVVVETAVVGEEDATNLTYTAPIWPHLDRGREHKPLQEAFTRIFGLLATAYFFTAFFGPWLKPVSRQRSFSDQPSSPRLATPLASQL